MPVVNYVEHDGSAHAIEVRVGDSVMQGAVLNGIQGIAADCGGACACATCHVYISPEWLSRVPPAAEMEKGMLEFALNATANSRLSCQIKMDLSLDGLVVTLPQSQY